VNYLIHMLPGKMSVEVESTIFLTLDQAITLAVCCFSNHVYLMPKMSKHKCVANLHLDVGFGI
jgi:hypothetical protein